MIANPALVPQLDHRCRRTDNLKRLAINQSGTTPSRELKRLARFKVKRELTSFGTDPKPILAAMQVGLLVHATTGNKRLVNPAKSRTTRSADRRSHRLALPLRGNCNALAPTPLQQNYLRMPSQKLKIALKSNTVHQPIPFYLPRLSIKHDSP
jgi:hypothetical protein